MKTNFRIFNYGILMVLFVNNSYAAIIHPSNHKRPQDEAKVVTQKTESSVNTPTTIVPSETKSVVIEPNAKKTDQVTN